MLLQERTSPLCARPTCALMPQIVPSSSTRHLSCAILPARRRDFEVDRIVSFHVLDHSVRKKTVQRFLRGLDLGLLVQCKPPPPKQSAIKVPVAVSSSISPFSFTSQLPVSSSIDALATMSSARPYLSASAPSPESVVSNSALFLDPESGETISTSLTRSRIGAVPRSFFVASTTSESDVFARNRRLGFSCVQLSLSPSLAMLHSGGIEGALPPADDDPPDRSVFTRFSVTLVGPPRRTKCCPSHDNPLTSFSREKSVPWLGASLRTVRAICRPASVTKMCESCASSRPHQKPLPQPLSPM